MKNFLFVSGLFLTMFFAKSTFGQCPVPGEPHTPVMEDQEQTLNPECESGGGGGPAPVFGGLTWYTPNFADFGPNVVADGIISLLDENGSNWKTPFFEVGLFNSQPSTNFEIYGLFPTFPGWGGGSINDEARSVAFAGNIVGRHFEFYDSPNGDKGDDWVEIYFKENPPSHYSYFVWTLERSYSDQYVTVIYHSHNGLDGKVSFFKSFY